MAFDKLVHANPDFYARKLAFIHSAKRLIYKLLFIDTHITKQREDIAARNEALLVKYLSGKTVLEVGCGRGSTLSSLHKKHQCKCVGLDISRHMIEYAETHNPGPTYRLINGSDLPFDDDQFDFVIFNYVLHHVDDLHRMIQEAKRVGKHIIIYECCAFDCQPWNALSVLYWKIVDGGVWYKSLNEWKILFGGKIIAEIEGSGLVRYGMCVFQKLALDQRPPDRKNAV